jgi:hypothetical protein
MHYRALFVSTLSCAALAAGVAFADEQTYDLSGFDAVSVSSGIDAEIAVGPGYSVRAESSAESLERIEIKVSGSELQIGRKSRFFSWGRHESIKVYVSLPALSALDVSSGAEAAATGVNADNFSIDASSGGNAEVRGTCKEITADVSSGGHIDAEALQCVSGAADASSGGHASVYTSESIVADASSGGHVSVYGSPTKVKTDNSSGGSVTIK